MKGADKINTPECYLDHQMLGSGISVTPKPFMAYSMQNGFENVEEANEKRNEKFSEVKFSRTYDWGRFFNPGPDGIVALDEALREYDSETNRLMQKYTSSWERQSIDQNIPWSVANEEKYGPEWYGITRGLDFLDFFLQVTPYNPNTGLADHPTVRKIVVNNPIQSGPGVEPLGII
jgi:hypothetical protein